MDWYSKCHHKPFGHKHHYTDNDFISISWRTAHQKHRIMRYVQVFMLYALYVRENIKTDTLLMSASGVLYLEEHIQKYMVETVLPDYMTKNPTDFIERSKGYACVTG